MGISPFYVIVLMVAGVLIFGKDLPEIMRKLGAALLEFRKGMSEVSSEIKRGSKGGNSNSCLAGNRTGKFEVPIAEVCESNESASFSENKFEPPV
ncbi:MAG: twin-arginine translocase TatA/TatE family subunit [Planctomycetaceae bacterium]|jgi:TatA/E family protein of Tat protein translocase|nr:twin-arginine translocase TatA/TatE family subunit [Planctomycetaceae bacterium]